MPVRTRWEAIAPVYRSRNGNGPGLPGPLSWRVDDASGVEGALEVADLVLGAVAVPAVLLLELAGQVLAVALGDVENVIRQVAPLLLGLALQLGPLAGDDVLVHALHLSLRGNGQLRNPAVTARSRQRSGAVAFLAVVAVLGGVLDGVAGRLDVPADALDRMTGGQQAHRQHRDQDRRREMLAVDLHVPLLGFLGSERRLPSCVTWKPGGREFGVVPAADRRSPFR